MVEANRVDECRHGGRRFSATVEVGDEPITFARGNSAYMLMVSLLTQLESAPEGSMGYIVEVASGAIIQRHRKVGLM